MPVLEEIYQNAAIKSSKVKIPQERWQSGQWVPQRYNNQRPTSHLEPQDHRCTRTNMLLMSLCVLLLCGIIVLGVLYAIKERTLQQPNNTGSTSGQCSDGWELFNGTCYYFSHDALNWTASRDECVTAGGHLVIINSKEEQIYIAQKIIDTDGFWIGLTDSEREGHWKWVDNKNVKLKFWYQGQPNNSGGAGNKHSTGEDCGLVRDVSQEHNWYDEYCGASNNRICEAQSK
ncbi:C-type lectin domain family 4 member E-like [Alosa alosa]|nr:C-type lectin domain family 4 member E-like [Alosa sapidissima]XP_041934869.1 C-type lectin domain family 4 member E-like [Alosa sapidissima]XP_041934871.1 C-type lectin domain family 4 member E-like [Alosa sapidissima]XP_048123909.1 C-type lectin domain family 4 member E-like [Alosa alosa]